MSQKTETKSHRIIFRLDDKLMESIRNRSENSNQRISTIVRTALENELYGATTPST
jgi:predicted DNA-binding protein